MLSLNDVLVRIDELCEKIGFSHYRLAKQAGIPLSSLNSMFDRNTTPTVATLEKLCKGLGITMYEFFKYTSPLPNEEEQSVTGLKPVVMEMLDKMELDEMQLQLLMQYLIVLQKATKR